MEKEPQFEKKEESPDKKLVRLLKEKGHEDPETQEFLASWTQEQEILARNAEDHFLAEIELNLKRARLYFEAGYIQEAFENFESAQEQAWNEERDDLYEKIEEEREKLGV